MYQMDELDGNGHRRRNNINHFAPLYESDYEEVTQNRNKSNNPSIALREK